MSDQDNLKVVQGVFECFGRGDVPGFLNLVSEDVRWNINGPEVVPYFGERRGHAGVVEFLTLLGSNIEMEAFEPREFISKDGRVVVIGGERGRVRATGKTFVNDWAMVFTLDGGKIVNFDNYENTAAVAEAFRS